MYVSPLLREAFLAAPWKEPGPQLVWGRLGEEDRNRQTRREVDMLLPLMPVLGQRFTGAGCMPTLTFQIIEGPLIITFNKHQIRIPSA